MESEDANNVIDLDAHRERVAFRRQLNDLDEDALRFLRWALLIPDEPII